MNTKIDWKKLTYCVLEIIVFSNQKYMWFSNTLIKENSDWIEQESSIDIFERFLIEPEKHVYDEDAVIRVRAVTVFAFLTYFNFKLHKIRSEFRHQIQTEFNKLNYYIFYKTIYVMGSALWTPPRGRCLLGTPIGSGNPYVPIGLLNHNKIK